MRYPCANIATVASSLFAHDFAFIQPLNQGNVVMIRSSASHVSPMHMGISDWMPKPIVNLFALKKSTPTRPRKNEGAALFRQLGVSEDASYEEIQEATLRLRAKHQGDRKEQVRIDKLKDDIMDLRLKQRMGSMSSGSSREAAAAEQAERNILNRKTAPRVPKWTRGLIVLPDREWAISAIYPFSIIGAFGVVFPSASKILILVSAVTAISRMSTREAPPIMKDELGQMGPIPPPSRTTVLLTLFSVISAGLLGVKLGALLGSFFGQSILVAESWRIFGIEVMFSLASLFLSTYRK